MSITNGLTGVLLAFAAFGVSGIPTIAHAQNCPNRSISVSHSRQAARAMLWRVS